MAAGGWEGGVPTMTGENKQSASPGSALRDRGSQMGKGRNTCPGGVRALEL